MYDVTASVTLLERWPHLFTDVYFKPNILQVTSLAPSGPSIVSIFFTICHFELGPNLTS